MGNCTQSTSDGVPRSTTAYKRVDSNQHAKLYPTLDDNKDYLECVDAEHASYRFASDDMENATQHLLENGFVVIKSVLNREEIEKGKSLLWEFAEPFGFDRKDYKSWNIHNIGGECENGLVWGKGMGQSDFQWFGRKNENVRKVFADIWSHDAFPLNSPSQNRKSEVIKIGNHEFVPNQNTKGLDDISDIDEMKEMDENGRRGLDEESESSKKEKIVVDPAKDLLTSFDGIGLFTPWYLTNEMDRTNSGWYHIDQNPVRKKGIHTIQGYVTYFDQNESTGSTVFIPKTHLEVAEAVDLGGHPVMMGDFIRVRAGNKLRDSSLFKKILLCCCAGDMVLWDSRS